MFFWYSAVNEEIEDEFKTKMPPFEWFFSERKTKTKGIKLPSLAKKDTDNILTKQNWKRNEIWARPSVQKRA